jgi:hypothetical protein
VSGTERIAAERRRQVEAEGWTPEHDAEHVHGELASAAVAYALLTIAASPTAKAWWPWSGEPGSATAVRNLEKAGALIAAEIDRLTGEVP